MSNDTPAIVYRRTGFQPGDSTIWLTQALPVGSEGATVYIKYSDTRFLHGLGGEMVPGTYDNTVLSGSIEPFTSSGSLNTPTDTLAYLPGFDRAAYASLTTVDQGQTNIVNTGVYVDNQGYLHPGQGATFNGDTIDVYYAPSWSYYFPTGWNSGNRVRMKGTVNDVTGGVVGIWQDSTLSGTNYFDPRRLATGSTDLDSYYIYTAPSFVRPNPDNANHLNFQLTTQDPGLRGIRSGGVPINWATTISTASRARYR